MKGVHHYLHLHFIASYEVGELVYHTYNHDDSQWSCV